MWASDSSSTSTLNLPDSHPPLSFEQAQLLRAAHLTRVAPWVTDRLSRASKASWHPVYDFLFSYYPFRPSKLQRWSPGCDVLVEHHDATQLDWSEFWVSSVSGVSIPSRTFPVHRRPYLNWAFKYLCSTAERAPHFGCFGLHEWAMVYKTTCVRHEYVPLRVSHADIDAVVESSDLRCSHFDAFRFFTPPAVPLNRTTLTRDTTTHHDQRGCVHVTMDLYKFAHKIAPWCSSDLVADTFLLAAHAREVDMRASPYDLSNYGFAPIRIETREGREEYITLQRGLSTRATPLRERLIDTYKLLLAQAK